jgi:ABC-2 type transport system permease protein
MTPHEIWIGYCGLVRKEVSRFMRIWPQTLLPSAITMTLYFMIFGHVMGQRIGQMSGINYMVFITPGLIMMAVMTSAFSNVVSSFFMVRYNRAIEELLVSPLPNSIIIAGFVSGGAIRGLIVGLITTIIGCIFSDAIFAHIFLSIFVIILTSLLFSLAGLINGIFARKFDDTSIVTTFVLTPLIYLGGIFYSITLLPSFWRTLSHLNPIYYMIELFRYAMLGTHYPNRFYALGFLITLVIGLFLFARWLMEKGIRIKQ